MTFKKISAFLLALMLFASCFSGLQITAKAADEATENLDWYGDGSASEFVLDSLGDFKGFVTLSQSNTFEGKTVKLGTDIVWNEGDASDWATTAPANVWTPIAANGSFTGTFDGQGHTVSGLYCVSSAGAAFIAKHYNATLKNVKIVNSYFKSTGTDTWNAGAGVVARAQKLTVSGVYTDAILEAVYATGLVAIAPSTGNTITNCWFDGTINASAQYAGGILGSASNNQTHTISNCLFTGKVVGTANTYVGGIMACGPYNATLNMSNCLVDGDFSGLNANGKTIGAIAGNVPGGNKGTTSNTYATAETYANLAGANGTVSKFGAKQVARKDIIGLAAKSVLTGFDFSTVWAPIVDGTPELRAMAKGTIAVAPDEETTAWFDGSKTEYVLNTTGELKGFATLSNSNNFAGITIKLGADMIFNPGVAGNGDMETKATYTWDPIGSADVPFAGIFDGQGHTVEGLYHYANYAGLVAYANGATVKNVSIKRSYFRGADAGSDIGAAIAKTMGACTVDSVYTDAYLRVGASMGIVGYVQAGSIVINNCWNAGTMNGGWGKTARGAGGIVGGINNNLTASITNCLSTVSQTATFPTGSYVGGIYGIAAYNTTLNVSNCLADAAMVAGYQESVVGAIAGNVPGGNKGTTTNTFATTETYANLAGANGTVSKFGAAFVDRADITGANAYTTLANFDFENVWVAAADGIPELKTFSTATPALHPDTETTAWFDGSKTEYVLNTLGELKGFATLSNTNDFEGITIKLGADMILNPGVAGNGDMATKASYFWDPIGSAEVPFKGHFDGQGYTIEGLAVVQSQGYTDVAFIAVAAGATIENVKINRSYLEGKGGGNTGAVVAAAQDGTVVRNVYSNAYLRYGTAMGLVAYAETGTVTISNCWFNGTMNGGWSRFARGAGAILGAVANSQKVIVTDCLATAAHTATFNGDYVGGLIGAIPYNASATVTNCLVKMTFGAGYQSSKVGAVVGNNGGANKGVFTNVYAVTGSYTALAGANGELSNFKAAFVDQADITDNMAVLSLKGFDFANTWIAVKDGTPELKAFSTATAAEDPVITGIAIKTNPTKTEYLVGEELDTAGLVLSVVYNNGYTVDVTDGYTVTGFNSAAAGEQTITVSYEGFTATYEVTVADPVVLVGIEVTLPELLTYSVADESLPQTFLDNLYENLTVYAVYSDGSKVALTEDEFTLTPPEDIYTIGRRNVTISYKGYEFTYEIALQLNGSDSSFVLDADGNLTINKTEITGSEEWNEQKALIKTITLNADTTSIAANVFTGYTALTDVYFPTHEAAELAALCGTGNDDLLNATFHGKVVANILQDLQNVTVPGGTVAEVTIVAEGDGLTYQWFYRDYGKGDFMPAKTQFAETYSVEMVGYRNGREVYCVITDAYGNTVTSAVAKLIVENTLTITQQPVSVAVPDGDTVTVTVTVSAEGEGLTYKWYYKDAKSNSFSLTNTFTGDTYSVIMNAARNGRQVYCVITDAYGYSVTTEIATISVKIDTALQILQQPVNTEVALGEEAVVKVVAQGEGLTYKWYYKNANGKTFSLTGTFTGDTYTAVMNEVRDGRQIYCVITDKYGNTVTSDVVTLSAKVSVDLGMNSQPADVVVAAGEMAEIKLDVQGEGLTYQWYYKEAKGKSFCLTGTFKGDTYAVEMNAARDGRQIYCVITDAHGNVITTNIITIAMAK